MEVSKVETKGRPPSEELLSKTESFQKDISQISNQLKEAIKSSNYPYSRILFYLKWNQMIKKQKSVFKKIIGFIFAWLLPSFALVFAIITLFTNKIPAAVAFIGSMAYWLLFDKDRQIVFVNLSRAENSLKSKSSSNYLTASSEGKIALWTLPALGIFGAAFDSMPMLRDIILYFMLYAYWTGLILCPVAYFLEKHKLKLLITETPAQINKLTDEAISCLFELKNIGKQAQSEKIKIILR